MLVKEMASFRELQLVNFEGKGQQDIAIVQCFADFLVVHSPVIETAIEAAETSAWRTANHYVWSLLLDEALGFDSVGLQEEVPTAPVAVLAQVEGLPGREVELRQSGELRRNSRR